MTVSVRVLSAAAAAVGGSVFVSAAPAAAARDDESARAAAGFAAGRLSRPRAVMPHSSLTADCQ